MNNNIRKSFIKKLVNALFESFLKNIPSFKDSVDYIPYIKNSDIVICTISFEQPMNIEKGLLLGVKTNDKKVKRVIFIHNYGYKRMYIHNIFNDGIYIRGYMRKANCLEKFLYNKFYFLITRKSSSNGINFKE